VTVQLPPASLGRLGELVHHRQAGRIIVKCCGRSAQAAIRSSEQKSLVLETLRKLLAATQNG
jgi:hypothetical protein